jgi:hypothetical protein
MTKMTRKAIKLALDTAEPRCGGCHFWRPYESDTKVVTEGSCRFNPPTWQLDSDDDEISGWPTVVAEEFACGQFKATQ